MKKVAKQRYTKAIELYADSKLFGFDKESQTKYLNASIDALAQLKGWTKKSNRK